MSNTQGRPTSRREFLKVGTASFVAGSSLTEECCAPVLWPGTAFSGTPDRYDVIIGTGFGATVAATELAPGFPVVNVLMLERGLFFTVPTGRFQEIYRIRKLSIGSILAEPR